MNAIDLLLREHEEILAEVAGLREAERGLRERGDEGLPEALPALSRFGRLMETTLARHARKEDEALFPAVEARLGIDGSPTTVMRQEHIDIHDRGSLFRRTLSELRTVEHPRLEARGEELRALSTGLPASGGSRRLQALAAEIIELIEVHFAKEEQILFPMARDLFDLLTLEEVGKKMEVIPDQAPYSTGEFLTTGSGSSTSP